MRIAGQTAARGHRRTYRLGSWIAALLVATAAFAVLGLTASANAATPTILNTSSTGGQTNWLESFSLSNDTGNQAHRVWITLTVRHDPGRDVTGIKIDDDYDGTDNTASKAIKAVTAQQPTVVDGYDHSRISYNYLPPTSGNSLDCGNVFGGHVPSSTKPIRIRARLDDGAETATSSSNIKWAGYDCTGKDDYPRIFDRSQSATSINVGQSVNFTFTGDDSDSPVTGNRDFGGVNYRLRRLSDGVTTAETKVCYGNSDNTARTLPVTFSRRGRWVVEAELRNSNSSCDTNPYNDAWFYLGAVDVNAPAADSPALTVGATRPQINGNTTVTATFDDADDSGEGGRVQNVEWDLDQNTGNGVSGFESIQLGTITGLSSPQTKTINTTGMTPGLKTVRARVTDNGAMSGADNSRRTKTVSATFLVDSPPVATAAAVETETGADLPITLLAGDADGDSLTYAITDGPDHGTLTGSGTDRTYAPDPGYAGTDEFTFSVNDGFGGTHTATISITVDPDIDPFAGPSGTLDSRGAEVSFGSAADGVTFECSLDESDWASCVSPFAPTDLPDGEHQVSVRALAGGQTSAPETIEWAIDAFPVIGIVNRPVAESSMTTAGVEFTLSEAGTTVSPTSECRLDNHAWGPCDSPVSYADLDDGPHRISIRATDAFGKQVSEDVEWTITTAGSETTIEAPVPVTFTRNDTASINFAAPGAVSFDCSLDGAGWAPCASPSALTALPDGFHTFRVRSIDALDNAEATPAQVSWRVDRTAPVVNITAGPTGPVPARPATFAFGSNEGLSSFQCSLDGANYTTCNSPFHLPGNLADGPHSFRVAATDRAGNRSLAAAREFRVLSAAPQVSLTGGPAQGAIVSSRAASFGFETDPVAAGFECSLDDADWEPCGPPATVTGLLDGPHRFAVQAIDEVGNRSPEPTVRDWTVDATAPETVIVAGPSARMSSGDSEFRFAASEDESSFECSLDGAAFAACESPLNLASLADGGHELRVRATDRAGNRDLTPAARAWHVDTTVAPPPEPPLPPAEPDPCTFLIEQDRCGDPYVVATVKAPYRKVKGKGTIGIDVDSGGSALGQVTARFPIGLWAKVLGGTRGSSIGRVVIEGATPTIMPMTLPARRAEVNVVGGGESEGAPVVTLKPRTVIVEHLPPGTTGAEVRLKSTAGLRINTSICGTRLWRTVLTDSSSNREDVDARADIKCIRKASR